jgi:hypothetical protein
MNSNLELFFNNFIFINTDIFFNIDSNLIIFSYFIYLILNNIYFFSFYYIII